jgi:dephospho-CoA kinase
LDNAYIASIVFKDKVKLEALNAVIHPKVQEHFKEYLKKTSAKFIIYEAAILFESGSDKLCDYIITVTASLKDRVKRVMLRDGTSKEQVLERMNHQLQDDLKIKKSDFVIRNSSLASTKLQVSIIYDLIVNLSN